MFLRDDEVKGSSPSRPSVDAIRRRAIELLVEERHTSRLARRIVIVALLVAGILGAIRLLFLPLDVSI